MLAGVHAAPGAQAVDELGLKGLLAHVECSERPDGQGGLDIAFSATRVPVPGSGRGTSTATRLTAATQQRIAKAVLKGVPTVASRT